jgi:hypothetical protein
MQSSGRWLLLVIHSSGSVMTWPHPLIKLDMACDVFLALASIVGIISCFCSYYSTGPAGVNHEDAPWHWQQARILNQWLHLVWVSSFRNCCYLTIQTNSRDFQAAWRLAPSRNKTRWYRVCESQDSKLVHDYFMHRNSSFILFSDCGRRRAKGPSYNLRFVCIITSASLCMHTGLMQVLELERSLMVIGHWSSFTWSLIIGDANDLW